MAGAGVVAPCAICRGPGIIAAEYPHAGHVDAASSAAVATQQAQEISDLRRRRDAILMSIYQTSSATSSPMPAPLPAPSPVMATPIPLLHDAETPAVNAPSMKDAGTPAA
eukprot:2171900-Pyramimonas_sp.AAC.1